LWICAAELVNRRKKIGAGVFVGGHVQATALQALEFAKGTGGFAPKSHKTKGVIAQKTAGGCERAVPGSSIEKDFPYRFF
jgi:hypothetical protein